jgi:asparagine synthase (glutamine-hydrolysing)
MCGIAGIFQPGLEADQTTRRLTAMNDAMAYRGPDDATCLARDGGGLAMRRLAIIDVDGGRQPVTNEDESLSLVMNGEIYNYRELGARLRRKGHQMRSASDTEVALHAAEDSPDDFLQQLRGMFALATWDRSNGSVMLAVDRLGIKPLYYVADERQLIFASEMRSLLASGLITPRLEAEALAQYFAYGYVAGPRSILQDVRRLQAGEALRWCPSEGAQIRRYWRLPAATEPWTGGTTCLRTEIRTRLRAAVESHLVSDVPLGAFLDRKSVV